MASERIHNEYDAVRIANGLDTLAENLAGYEAGTPVTPTDAMKAKLPSQSTGDRISDAMEGLAQGLTNISHPQRISYEDWSALTPQEKANGTQYYIYDYPSVDGSLYAPVTSVATPENGDTASKTYAVGEMFIRGGKLCTCLVAIAQGGTFVKDTNYKEGDVGSVLTELNSNFNNAERVYNTNLWDIRALKIGNLCCLMFQRLTSEKISADPLFTLPTKYRPILTAGASNYNGNGFVSIDSSGNVQISMNSATYFIADVTYITNS